MCLVTAPGLHSAGMRVVLSPKVLIVSLCLVVRLSTAAGADSAYGTLDGGSAHDPSNQRPSWAPSMKVLVKPASANIGDPIEVTIVLTHDRNVSATLPVKIGLGDFSELSRSTTSKVTKKNGAQRTVDTIRLVVAAYKLGRIMLPALDVHALGPSGALYTLSTEPLSIDIRSIMPNEPNPKLKSSEPPVSVWQRDNRLLYAAFAAGVFLLGGIAALILRHLHRRRMMRRKAAKTEVPSYLLAEQRMAALDVEGLIEKRQFKQLYLELSELSRQYVGGLHQFDALEMTTDEIYRELIVRMRQDSLRHRLQLFWNQCDLVKFAKYRPDPEEARHAVEEAQCLMSDVKSSIDHLTRSSSSDRNKTDARRVSTSIDLQGSEEDAPEK